MSTLKDLAQLTVLFPDCECAGDRLVVPTYSAATPYRYHKTSRTRGEKRTRSTDNQILQRRLEPSEEDAQNLIHFVKIINGELEEEIPVRSKRGRKVKAETKLLMKFVSPKGKVPKKEYLRIRILRGLRKLVQKCTEHGTTLKGINQVLRLDDAKASTNQAWEVFMGYYTYHISEIHLHFNEVDFKTRNKEGNFNNDYCRRVLGSPLIKRLYKHYINLLFADLDPALLCCKFNINCCRLCHANECLDKWEELKDYLLTSFINEIGMLPDADNEDGLHNSSAIKRKGNRDSRVKHKTE
jgi:hypothetical protein